jgi:hypothetical protein
MAVPNIERFDELTGSLLVALYAAFPMPVALVPENYVGKSWMVDNFSGALFASEEAEFFAATVQWLNNAGYLRYQEMDPAKVNGFTGAVLTAKGLELLKAIPDSLGGSFGERLGKAAAAEGREGLRALVSQVLGAGISLLTRQ